MRGLRLIIAAVLAVAGGAAEAARASAGIRIDGGGLIADLARLEPGRRISGKAVARVRAILPVQGGTWAMPRCSLGPMQVEAIYRRRAASLVKRAAATDDDKRRVLLLARAADWQRRALALRTDQTGMLNSVEARAIA
jgi:hypothetical protein